MNKSAMGMALSLAVIGCTTTHQQQEKLAYQAADSLFGTQPKSDAWMDYAEQFRQVVNKEDLYRKNGCSGRGIGSIRLILRVEQDGSIGEVVPNEENKKSQCYRQTFKGVTFPPPPFAPLYLQYLMKDPF